MMLLTFFAVVFAITTLFFGGMAPLVSPILAVLGSASLLALPFMRVTFTPAQAKGVLLGSGLAVAVIGLVALSLIPAFGPHPFTALLADYGLQAAWPAASLSPGRTLGNLALLFLATQDLPCG